MRISPPKSKHSDSISEFRNDDSLGYLFVVPFQLSPEERTKGIFLQDTLSMHERVPMWHVQFDASDSCSVLTAVVLFLHEEEQLLEPIQGCSIFFRIVGQGPFKPDQGDATLVLYQFTH
jgi:hypothetical protein